MIYPLLAIGLPGISELFVISAILSIFLILPFWFILRKAGFHPAISLLTVIPAVCIFILFFLAFAPWPNQKEKK